MDPKNTDIYDLLDEMVDRFIDRLESYDGETPRIVRDYLSGDVAFSFNGQIYPIDPLSSIYPQIFAVVDAHNKSL